MKMYVVLRSNDNIGVGMAGVKGSSRHGYPLSLDGRHLDFEAMAMALECFVNSQRLKLGSKEYPLI